MAHNRVTYVSRALRLIQPPSPPPPPSPPRDRHGRPAPVSSSVRAEAKIRIKVCPPPSKIMRVFHLRSARRYPKEECNGTSAFLIPRFSAQRISSMLERTTSGVPPCDLMEDSAVVVLLEAAFRIRGMIETTTTFQRYWRIQLTTHTFAVLSLWKPLSRSMARYTAYLLIFVDKYREKNSHF